MAGNQLQQYKQIQMNNNSNQLQQQVQRITMSSSTISLSQIEQSLATKYLSIDPINQLEIIRSQFQLLQSIKQIVQKRKNSPISGETLTYANGLNSTFTTNILDDSINGSSFQAYRDRDTSYEYNQQSNGRSKFAQQMKKSTIASALKEVQNNCSQETYDLVKQYLASYKIKQNENLQKITAKLIEERDQLASQLLIIKIQKSNLQKQLDSYRKIAISIDDEKRQIKKKIDYILKKQNQVFKLQSSFTFKQKINLQLKKRYERLVGSYLTNQAKFQKIYEQLDKIWNQINKKMCQTECSSGCWKKQIMKKARQQLISQRKLIKQESIHLQKQYEVMSIVSEQFKKIFQQPCSNERIQTENNEPNSQKSIRLIDNKQITKN